ncbi:hypothetical protein F2Q69_00012032 [Brassica cretica]|nr:hypothetical protein F2Q69_00012032 [Brassica cretica]
MGSYLKKHRGKLERVDRTYRCYYHQARVCYPHGGVHYRPVRNVQVPEPYKPELFNICLELSVGGRDGSTVVQDDGHTCTFRLATRHLEAYDGKKKLGPKDTEEGLNRLRYTLA